MSLENISPSNGSNTEAGKRLGRGQSSGKGGTSSRGHKGAKSRSGYSKKLVLKVVRCHFKEEFQNMVLKILIVLNTSRLILDKIQNLAENKMFNKELNIDQMVKLRLIRKNDLVKILGRGKLTIPIKITAHKFSTSAKSAIEAAGGEAITL